LEAGTYTVFAKAGWNYSDEDEFVLTSYGAGAVVIEEI